MRDSEVSWSNRFLALSEGKLEKESRGQVASFLNATTPAYKADHTPEDAVADFVQLIQSREYSISLWLSDKQGKLNLSLYKQGERIPLDQLVSLFNDMSLRVLSETSLKIPWGTLHHVCVQQSESQAIESWTSLIEGALRALFDGKTESDRFQGLMIKAGLSWEECRVIRAYARYLQQLRLPYGQTYMGDILLKNSSWVENLIELFHARFSPKQMAKRETTITTCQQLVEQGITEATSYDEERVLRAFYSLVMGTVRTNFYQKTSSEQNQSQGEAKLYISFKFESALIEGMPEPRPMFEIFVYAPFVEGVHLRNGKVARGGLRWSNRKEDYRDEILSLMQTQVVKNALIVPTGAKGGFLVKENKLEGSKESPDAYLTFVRGLLDVTDNRIGGQIRGPTDIVRLDDADPYLVVAADKGTTTRSDDANRLSAEYNFWLGDAFASGGSQGYDHKKLGITARGAWKSVEHHFRVLGIDMKEPFSVVGVGDMSGDVFGNGMLLAESIKLVAAFDHRHIFIDPDPDPKVSFQERKRLFQQERSSWQDYNEALISEGGGVFPRQSRVLPLSRRAREALSLMSERPSPQDVVKAILKAPADLLWFGGIGTFIKSAHEAHASASDSTNDDVRINADEVRARVIVEGANLAITREARVSIALKGCQLNTDALDNSAGVTCSDYEVNIKILCAILKEKEQLTEQARNELLRSMEAEVTKLVLQRNVAQNAAVYCVHLRGDELFDAHHRLLIALEKSGDIKRTCEGFPDEETLAARKSGGLVFTRPELATLLSFSKIDVYRALLQSNLLNDPYFDSLFEQYFPALMRRKYGDFFHLHPLCAEIKATELTNSLCDEMGPAFVSEIEEHARVSKDKIVKAICIAKALLGRNCPSILDLEEKPPKLLKCLLKQRDETVKRLVLWFLRRESMDKPSELILEKYKEGFSVLSSYFSQRLFQEEVEASTSKDDKIGVQSLESLSALAFAPDLIQVQCLVKKPILFIASAYEILGKACGFDWLRETLKTLPELSSWQQKAFEEVSEQIFSVQQHLCMHMLANFSEENPEALFEAWKTSTAEPFRAYLEVLQKVQCTALKEISPLVVLDQACRRLYEKIVGTCIMTVSLA